MERPSFSGFDAAFEALTRDGARCGRGYEPMQWQRRLYGELVEGRVPPALDLPTGLGKTSVMAIWLIAWAYGAKLPRRLVYVVDRRAVVDQATAEAEKLRDNVKAALGVEKLPISTLRGRFVDNREWLSDPAAPAIIVGTVDMIGSRLLFSGYGVSPKMRPYHAGLLGMDVLVLLDEAHLVPPFAHLLRVIEQDASLWPKSDADCKLLPRFTLLPLSATHLDMGESGSGRLPFRLDEADWQTDCVVRKRLGAKKRLRLEPLSSKEQDRQLAEAAWALASKDGRFSRVAVFCERRERGDEGGGPSAQGVVGAIKDLAKADKKAGRPQRQYHPIELLVGARRVYERQGVAKRLRELGFIGEKKPLEMPAFLVATSAGEVGVDIDADHMVSDLVAWERMVQRLGRVNRRGEGDAELTVFWSEPAVKNADAPTPPEQSAQTAFAAKSVIENLPQSGRAFDVSPGAIRALAERARADNALKTIIERATTPKPLRPALNRALVDAWSMTSLEQHTGRPEVAPWLRGWVEDDRPQTSVIWRTHLPLREGVAGWPRNSGEKQEVEDFFEAAPPHESEKLETETYRFATWLQERAKALLGRKPSVAQETTDGEPDDVAAAALGENASEIARMAPKPEALKRDDIVALVLSSDGDCVGHTLGDLEQERKGEAKKEFDAALAGKLLILDARLGGLNDGLLDATSHDAPETADAITGWSAQVGFRVQPVEALDEGQDEEWRFEDAFVLSRDADGTPQKWLRVDHLKQDARKEDARSIAKPQELSQHQDWARRQMLRIVKGVGLSGSPVAAALALAASLHDEGKRAQRWQRAFKAPRDAARCGLSQPLAKTRGPIDQALLDGYRHEFGSLPYVEANGEFKNLLAEWQELVLHLVAAHHGFARPVIATRGCEDAPPSLLEERARDVALRFARLQKRWGPWGLAWLEALLRAADAQASRDNDEGKQPPAPEAER